MIQFFPAKTLAKKLIVRVREKHVLLFLKAYTSISNFYIGKVINQTEVIIDTVNSGKASRWLANKRQLSLVVTPTGILIGISL